MVIADDKSHVLIWWSFSGVTRVGVTRSRRAGLTIVPVVPWEGVPRRQSPDQLPFFSTLFWRVGFLNVTTPEKVVNFLAEEKCTPEKAPRENPGYAYKKRAPALRWYEAPEWLIRPWSPGAATDGVTPIFPWKIWRPF